MIGFFSFSAHGMGLERIVTPVITMFVTTIASAIIGMLIFFIEGRQAIKNSDPLDEIQDPFKSEPIRSAMNEKITPPNPTWPAWKKFAFEAAREPN